VYIILFPNPNPNTLPDRRYFGSTDTDTATTPVVLHVLLLLLVAVATAESWHVAHPIYLNGYWQLTLS
jgi:hypothetical protein